MSYFTITLFILSLGTVSCNENVSKNSSNEKSFELIGVGGNVDDSQNNPSSDDNLQKFSQLSPTEQYDALVVFILDETKESNRSEAEIRASIEEFSSEIHSFIADFNDNYSSNVAAGQSSSFVLSSSHAMFDTWWDGVKKFLADDFKKGVAKMREKEKKWKKNGYTSPASRLGKFLGGYLDEVLGNNSP